MFTERSFPNPRLSQGVVMCYKQYFDTTEYIGLVPKKLTEEVIGLGHVMREEGKKIHQLTTTEVLLAELEFELDHIPLRHTKLREPLQTKINEIKNRH